MKTTDIALVRTPRPEPELDLRAMCTPLLRSWRLVAGALLISWGATLALVLIPEREYKAEVILAAVPNTKMASLAGGISSLLGNAQLGGVQSTPYFVTRLLTIGGVVRAVAHSPGPGEDRTTIIERVLDRPAAEIRVAEVEPQMRDIMAANVDKQTGLVTFSVTHRDSALARWVNERVVSTASQTFVRVARSQASEQRAAGLAHADSVRRQLRRAEQQLQAFGSSHRVYANYSEAALERQRLERDVANAQTAYTQAMSDQQAAIARELEDTPALVVVDPIASELTPEPRQAVLKLLLASVLGMVGAAMVLAFRGDFAPRALHGVADAATQTGREQGAVA
jgi:uncharacterized protein involved in exopolysaccharide biosynthesis